MSTFNVEIEVGAWLTESGIETTVYIGQGADTPAVETHETYQELIERSLTSYTIINDKITPEHYAEVTQFIEGLQIACGYAVERAIELGWKVEA